jgi:prepilin-type N-terminal cleavage/methylation domain-containing protein
MMSCLRHSGFTLAELLVGLAVLGLISALTIPSVFTSIRDHQRRTTIKEATSIVHHLVHNALNNGKGSVSLNDIRAINSIRMCDTTDATRRTSTSVMYEASSDNNVGFVLPSGAYVWAISPVAANADHFIIDWNGNAGANVVGDDILVQNICYDPTVPNIGGRYCSWYHPSANEGMISDSKLTTDNTTLYNKIFTV